MMNRIIVRGGRRLSGRVKIHGAKNAVLPIIAASILGIEGDSVIHDAPPLDDVIVINSVLESIGIEVEYHNETIRINAQNIRTCEASYELVRKMRASFLVMGPLLTRMGQARISLPGGCAIGTRPIDQHLKGFEAMGAEIELGQGYIEARVQGRLKGAKIYLDVASVGATENIMMAATLAEGTTTIENAAKEPEIVDLANYLNAMGATIRGAGTGLIRIDGVDKLKGAVHTVIPTGSKQVHIWSLRLLHEAICLLKEPLPIIYVRSSPSCKKWESRLRKTRTDYVYLPTSHSGP